MRALKPALLLLSVALVAALIGHVTIDVLGDYLLAHDAYDDIDHTSRTIVGLVTLGLTVCGMFFGLRAAVCEAGGSENAFCFALRAALPRRVIPFVLASVVLASLVLCAMESCDALLAGHDIDDVGDLFGGSIAFGETVVAAIAIVTSLIALAVVRRLARARIIAGVVVAFLRRDVGETVEGESEFEIRHRLVFRRHCARRRVAGRAPPRQIRARAL